jgi:hypothetical protein
MIWTNEKIKKLTELYPSTENLELSNLLGIKKGTIISKANSIGLYKTNDFMIISRKKRIQCKQTEWTGDEEDFIRCNYQNISNSEIALKLNKTRKSVIRKLGRMGIKRTKEETDFLRAKKSKENGRDLSYDFVKNEALKYTTRSEFSYVDNGVYNKAREFGLLSDLKHLAIGGSISIPQLILKDILEYVMCTECSFNDRNVIKPLEIDCYFNKWRIGWEYNGKRFHTDEKDLVKIKICEELGIRLFVIDEKSKNYRNYVENIKTQLLRQIKEIEKITGMSINANEVMDYQPKLNFLFMLKSGDVEKCKNRKLSDIKKNDNDLYKRIKKYNLIDCHVLCIVNDTKKLKRFKTMEEHINYLSEVKCKYSSFSELSMNEHLYRKIKKWNVTIDEMKKILGYF